MEASEEEYSLHIQDSRLTWVTEYLVGHSLQFTTRHN